MNLLRANRPTSASITCFNENEKKTDFKNCLQNFASNRLKSTLTLLLAVAPPAHSKLRKLYDDTLTFQVLRLNDNVPTVPQRRNAA